jgi:hypothetical protein
MWERTMRETILNLLDTFGGWTAWQPWMDSAALFSVGLVVTIIVVLRADRTARRRNRTTATPAARTTPVRTPQRPRPPA